MRQFAALLLAFGFLLLTASLPLQAQPAPGPFDSQSPLEPPTLVAGPTATVTPTATETPVPTATPEPTATPTATVAPYQVSPLVAQETGRLSDSGSSLWIGAAALLVLGGSIVLAAAERRGK